MYQLEDLNISYSCLAGSSVLYMIQPLSRPGCPRLRKLNLRNISSVTVSDIWILLTSLPAIQIIEHDRVYTNQDTLYKKNLVI